MSLWKYAAMVDGWNKAHGGAAKPEPPTAAQFEAAKRLHGDD
jgi:hypothetical protein